MGQLKGKSVCFDTSIAEDIMQEINSASCYDKRNALL